jgi:hypothetical protein
MPRYRQILKKLTSAKAISALSDMLDDNCQLAEDLARAEAKLNGTWPGWDWIIEEKKKREKSK